MRVIAICLLAAALLGCQTAKPPAPPPPARALCLPVVPYSPQKQTAIRRALDGLPAASVLHGVVRDYLALRDAARAACSQP